MSFATKASTWCSASSKPTDAPDTEDMVGDLEVVPRRKLDYRGVAMEEMDVDAILARKPEVAVVDELAHTNVAGSKHEKRYQDIEELLAAGINVITAMNIQHVESLNPMMKRLTGRGRARNGARLLSRARRPDRQRRRHRRGAARAAARGQNLSGGADRARAEELFQAGQPRLAARSGAARGRARTQPPARGPRSAPARRRAAHASRPSA